MAPLGHDGPVKTVTIDWDPVAERFVSEGAIRGQRVDINAPHVLPDGEGRHGPSGYSASELLLAAAGSCAAWDVVEIVRKQRQDVPGADRVCGRRAGHGGALGLPVGRAAVHGAGARPRERRAAAGHRRWRWTGIARSWRPSGAWPRVTSQVEIIERARRSARGPAHRRVLPTRCSACRRTVSRAASRTWASSNDSVEPWLDWRWWVIGAWAIVALVALPLAPQAPGVLQPGGFTAEDLEAARARRLLEDRLRRATLGAGHRGPFHQRPARRRCRTSSWPWDGRSRASRPRPM